MGFSKSGRMGKKFCQARRRFELAAGLGLPGNGDPDADREPPLGHRNQISGVAGHRGVPLSWILSLPDSRGSK